MHLAPHSGVGTTRGKPAPANLTDYELLVAPIVATTGSWGVVEVWQRPGRGPAGVVPLQFLVHMAGLRGPTPGGNRSATASGSTPVTEVEAFGPPGPHQPRPGRGGLRRSQRRAPADRLRPRRHCGPPGQARVGRGGERRCRGRAPLQHRPAHAAGCSSLCSPGERRSSTPAAGTRPCRRTWWNALDDYLSASSSDCWR